MNLLLAEGHAYARLYPVATVWAEAQITKRRKNTLMTNEAVLLQAAVADLLATKKRGDSAFAKTIKELNDG